MKLKYVVAMLAAILVSSSCMAVACETSVSEVVVVRKSVVGAVKDNVQNRRANRQVRRAKRQDNRQERRADRQARRAERLAC